MITFPRRLAQQVRTVMRRAFGSRGPGPAVCFDQGPDGLRVRASYDCVAVEYRDAGASATATETLWLPFQALEDFAAKSDELVSLEISGPDRITAQWRDKSVPQLVQHDSRPAPEPLPELPDRLAANPPHLLDALQAAAETCDPESTRYALGCIQMKAEGTLCATDGRQMLIQRGFSFPWDDNLLVPRCRAFHSAELPRNEAVAVGRTDDWVAIACGRWTFYLAINKEGRFPEVECHVGRPDQATAKCRFSLADADFLIETLPRMPSDETYNEPLTLDLNGSIAVRSRRDESSQPTEVVLTGSEREGEDIRLQMNRKYLARALKLGFHELFVYGGRSPAACHDPSRSYVWALLDPDSAIKPSDDAIRIESPQSGSIPSQPRIPTRSMKKVKQPKNTNGDGQAVADASTNGQATNRIRRSKNSRSTPALIEQAEQLRTALREALLKTNELIKAIKHQRRESRLVHSTLESLRQLKSIGV